MPSEEMMPVSAMPEEEMSEANMPPVADVEMPEENPMEGKPTTRPPPVKDTCDQLKHSLDEKANAGTIGSFFYDLMCVTDLTDLKGIDFMGRICGLLDVMDMMEQPLSESETYLYNKHCEMTGKKKVFQRI